METVLGLSVTATNVQTVLVEGRDADGATLEHGEFAAFSGDVSPARASEQVAEAVLPLAQAEGHRLHAIGVTWSRDADLEAALVIDSLADLGFDNVVPVQLPRAAEALACSIGRVIGYRRTAVCVVEPHTVVLSLVDTFDGEVETLIGHPMSGTELLDWVSSIFDRDDWRPEGLFVVGSVGGLDTLAAWLEQGLGLPVFDPPEAELALAHGAALASTYGPVIELGSASGYPDFSPAPDRRRALRTPTMMLAGAAVTFVVSVALAISPHLLPARDAAPADTVKVRAEVPAPAAVMPAPAAPAVPPPVAAVPPAVEEPPAAPAPAVEEAPAEPVYEPAPAVEPAPAPVEQPPLQFNQVTAPEPPAPAAPPAFTYPGQPVVIPQVPAQKPRLRDRILDKIPGLNRLGD